MGETSIRKGLNDPLLSIEGSKFTATIQSDWHSEFNDGKRTEGRASRTEVRSISTTLSQAKESGFAGAFLLNINAGARSFLLWTRRLEPSIPGKKRKTSRIL